MVDLKLEKEIGLGNSFEYDSLNSNEILIDSQYKHLYNMTDDSTVIVQFQVYKFFT